MNNLNQLLQRFATTMGIIITKPIVQHASNRITITVGYIGIDSPVNLSLNSINILCDSMSMVLGCPVHITFIQLNNHYSDANVLAHYLATIIGVSGSLSQSFLPAMRYLSLLLKLGTTSNLLVSVTGIKVQVSGRITSEPVRPRQTVQSYMLGKFNNMTIQTGSYTACNTIGNLTIKVWLGIG